MKSTLKKVLFASLIVIFGALIYFRGHPEVFSFFKNPNFFEVSSETKKTDRDEAKELSSENRLSGSSSAKKSESNQALASDKKGLAQSPSVIQPKRTAGILPASKSVPQIKGVPGPSLRAQVEQGRSIADILKNADLSIPEVRARVVAEMSSLDERQQKAVLDKAAQLNIPVRIEGPGHKVSLLYDFVGDEPVYRTTLNINAAISTGANLLNAAPYGLDGTGVTVGLWDEARARIDHVELSGKVTIMDGVTANSDHSTHCAGTIAGKGVDAKAKGMGTATRINSFDWNSDYAEMTTHAAVTATQTNMLSISSHSYGIGLTNVASIYNPYLGVYEAEAVNTDVVAYAAPYHLIFWAAGNEQADYTTRGGYQSITFNALAKNIITIGAADDAVTSGTRNPAVGSIAYFSSEGPCDDGRIKPDIVANGVNLYSCVASNTASYDTYSGTSMATPNASGSAALLVQLYKSNFPGQIPKASTLKALMIHTADDVGRPGPDYQYGWGYLNVKAAADVILAHKGSLAAPKIIEGSITSANKVQTNSFVWDGSSPIRATLVWTDPAGTARATNNSHSHVANLVHDLDLKITGPNGSTTNLPYVMPYVGTWTTNSMTNNAVTGTNKVDNVERIDIPAPTQPGTYTITVGMYGTNALTQSNQAYSLIVTGGVNVEANPPPVVNITTPADGSTVLPGLPISISAMASDMAVGGQPGQVTKVEFFDGSTPLGEDTSAPYEFSWVNATSGVHVITAKATDSEGATTVSSAVNVTVLVGDGKPVISSFSPTSGIAGDLVTINGDNLGVASSVRFGSIAAIFSTNSASQVIATVPTSAVTAPITISNSYGSVTSSSNFSILPVVFREDFSSVTTGDSSSTGGSSTAWSGNTNFPSANLVRVYQAGGAVKLGFSSATGSMTSRPINLAGNGGAFTISFKVKGWTSVQAGDGIIITAGSQSQTVTYAATMNDAYETKTQNFTGGTSATTITITTTGKRAFIDDVMVTATVPTSPPVITSPSSAGGIAGQAFIYTITASNSPTSFGATNLPAWANINPTNGLISSTNPTAGTNVVTISASNSVGVASTNLTITILPSGGGGGVTNTIFSENFGTPTGTNTLTAYASGVAPATFQNKGLLAFGQGDQASPADVRVTSVSSNYPSASGGGNIWFTTTSGAYGLSIEGINASQSSQLQLSYGYLKNSATAHASFSVDYWNGSSWVTVENTSTALFAESATAATGWYPAKNLSLPVGAQISGLKLRFVKTGTLGIRIDDVKLTGVAAAVSPSISAVGTLSAVSTTYGTASANPASFTVSGTNLNEAILVTPPAGFEVSQTAGGASGYAATQTVGSAGTVPSTTLYLRLAAGTAVGAYSGNLVCSSLKATSASVPVPESNVLPKSLSITANNRSKPFGATLSVGAGQTEFSSSGLVRGETIGSVTLSATGGTSANDSAGIYLIYPSDATGGAFSPSNYDITYSEGQLTVTGVPFSNPAPGADPDGNGLSNLMEYYMGISNGSPLIGPAITFSNSGATLSMTYRRYKGLDGVQGTVEHIENLTATNWDTNGVTVNQVVDRGVYEEVTATVTNAPGETKKFMRLRVTAP